MSPTPRLSGACIVIASAFPLLVHSQAPQAQGLTEAPTTVVRSAALWRDRGNIGSLDLIYGAGGKEHQPGGTFTFVQEDTDGTQPKFEIVDQQGVRWKAKLGVESKSETAATRLVWAAGYFTDEDYYLPELRVEKMPKLGRGREFVSANGVVHGVRVERSVDGQKKSGNWSWSKHPLAGTRELNGLRIMMALMNNWDLKSTNNSIYEVPGEAPYYAVSDLGATFGKTGGAGAGRTKSRLDHYSSSKFIEETELDEVDLTMKSRPIFLLAIVDPYHYLKLAGRAKVGKDIPRIHAKWLGQLLGQLSAEQIRDCFRAAGYSPQEVEGFAKVVQGRIAELNQL